MECRIELRILHVIPKLLKRCNIAVFVVKTPINTTTTATASKILHVGYLNVTDTKIPKPPQTGPTKIIFTIVLKYYRYKGATTTYRYR